MDTDLEKKLGMRKKSIKEFTSEDWRKYNHNRYEKDKERRLKY